MVYFDPNSKSKSPIRTFAIRATTVFRCSLTKLSPTLNIKICNIVKGFQPFSLDKPVTYNQKMQWQKAYDHDDRYTMLADKYAVRKYVEERIGSEYLIPLLGKWDKSEDIDFDSLPNQFVLKCNHDCASVIICRDKASFDYSKAKSKLEKALKRNQYYQYAEWQYKNIKPCIIAEKYMHDEGRDDLTDYKFQCFSGKPYFCRIDIGRYSDHRRNIYDMNWQLQDWQKGPYRHTDASINKPGCFEEMIKVATLLSEGLRQVRVDLYDVGGHVYFGEMTITNGGGFEKFEPEAVDEMLGNLWPID